MCTPIFSSRKQELLKYFFSCHLFFQLWQIMSPLPKIYLVLWFYIYTSIIATTHPVHYDISYGNLDCNSFSHIFQMQRHDVVLCWNPFSTQCKCLKLTRKGPYFCSSSWLLPNLKLVTKIRYMRQTKYYVNIIMSN